MSEKIFYWIQKPVDFYRDIAIKKMRKQPNGAVLTIIYDKLLLFTANEVGYYYFRGIYDSIAEELAEEINESEEDTRQAIEYLEKNKLLEQQENEYIYIPAVAEMVGSETAAAGRKRKQREREKAAQCDNVTLDCDNVTDVSQRVTNCHTEGEGEGEKEGEKEKEGEGKGKAPAAPLYEKLSQTDLTQKDYCDLCGMFGESITKEYYKKASLSGEKRKRVIDNTRAWIIDKVNKDYTAKELAEVKQHNNDLDYRANQLAQIEALYME